MSEIEKELQLFGVKPTAMRILIYKFIKDQSSALSLTTIESFFEKSDRTTLYRTVKTFEENGIVHQIEDSTGVPKFALCKHDHKFEKHNDLHLHFHCSICSDTVCLTAHKIPPVSLPENYTTEDINMLIKGICEKCNNLNKRNGLNE